MKYRGVAYYPEAWPSERWDRDIELMLDAGINLVRMGEFAWSRFEPDRDQADLDWWVDITSRMDQAGISVLACTPSAAPPAWLTSAYPEALAANADGTRRVHGGRRHYCPTSPAYRDRVGSIVKQLADAVRGNRSVVGWQIDNEIAAVEPCCCALCAEAFRNWLRERYGSLPALNEAWGNVFWSGDFTSWDQVQPPQHRVSWQLDYRRFQDQQFAEFIQMQADVLRAVKPDWQITTNLWVGLNPGGNATAYIEGLDVAAYDGYWDYYADREHYSSVWDLYRNVMRPRRPFWITETGAWNPDTTVANGLAALRPWAYEALAKGNDAHVYFRWRQSRMGEEDHPAVLDWSGEPGRPYDQVKELFHEMAGLGDAIRDLPLPEADVAVLFDYDTAVCGELEGRDYQRHLVETNVTLNRLQVVADILPVREGLGLSSYKLVLCPQLEMVDDWLAGVLAAYVAEGGVLLAQPRLSTLDRNAKYVAAPIPHRLTNLFGLRVVERWPVQAGGARMMKVLPAEAGETGPPAVPVQLGFDGKEATGQCLEYMEMLDVGADTRTLATYAGGIFAGSPAVAERVSGKGAALYQACWLDFASTSSLLQYALRKADVAFLRDIPHGVEILKRGDLRFYLNHNAAGVEVPLAAGGEPLLGEITGDAVGLAPFGVTVIRE